jgi:hypothetical protein
MPQTESMAKPAELAAAFAICARSVKLDDLEINILSRTVAEAHSGGMLGLGGTTARVPALAIRGIGPELIRVDMPAPTGDQATTS